MSRQRPVDHDIDTAIYIPLVPNTPWKTLLFLVLLVLTFAQSPLYTDNQNTKFLFGAAKAGYGYLMDDWMLKTLDPMPVFTKLIEEIYRYTDPAVFYLIFGLMVAIYGYHLIGISRRIEPRMKEPEVFAIFMGLFFAANCHLLLGGIDGGVAGQYLLGDYYQPCVMGVLLLTAIQFFLDHRLIQAAAAMTLAAVFHPFYIPTSLLLLSAMSVHWLWQRRGVGPVSVSALLFSLFVIPLTLQYKATFPATTPELWNKAIYIISVLRIPHHTQVSVFFSHKTVFMLIVMISAFIWVGKTPLRWILAVLLIPILFFIPYLYFFPNVNLSYTSPWRTSVIVYPIAATVLLTRLSVWLRDRLRERSVSPKKIRLAVTGVIALAVCLGIADHIKRYIAYHRSPEAVVTRFAKEHAKKGQIYLIPPKKHNFQSFRMDTGLPVLATWKTHPFKDIQVMEWYERSERALSFYEKANDPEICRLADTFVQDYGITHVVVPEPEVLSGCPGVRELYGDAHYRVVELPGRTP
jgi:hypothetical protein